MNHFYAVAPVPPPIHCDFCGHLDDKQRIIVAGPRVFICECCIVGAGQIVAQAQETAEIVRVFDEAVS